MARRKTLSLDEIEQQMIEFDAGEEQSDLEDANAECDSECESIIGDEFGPSDEEDESQMDLDDQAEIWVISQSHLRPIRPPNRNQVDPAAKMPNVKKVPAPVYIPTYDFTPPASESSETPDYSTPSTSRANVGVHMPSSSGTGEPASTPGYSTPSTSRATLDVQMPSGSSSAPESEFIPYRPFESGPPPVFATPARPPPPVEPRRLHSSKRPRKVPALGERNQYSQSSQSPTGLAPVHGPTPTGSSSSPTM